MTNELYSSEEYARNLVETIVENCNNVEELAWGEITARHIPLLNSTLCLTNEDCKFILDKCHRCHNVLEHSLLLIVLTDFISCVSANSETFPLQSRKCGKKGIAILLKMLQSSWGKLFTGLSAENMSVGQMTSIMRILKGCSERVPSDKSYKMFLEIILKMTEKALHELLKPATFNSTQLHPEKKPLKEIDELPHAATKTPMVLQPSIVHRRTEHKKEKKTKKKQKFDITRFILKSCENVITGESNEETRRKMHRKRKLQKIEKAQQSLEDQQMGKDSVVLAESPEAPQPKKHCVHNDFINGKVNAFKMLMKPRKTVKQLQNISSSNAKE